MVISTQAADVALDWRVPFGSKLFYGRLTILSARLLTRCSLADRQAINKFIHENERFVVVWASSMPDFDDSSAWETSCSQCARAVRLGTVRPLGVAGWLSRLCCSCWFH